MRACRIMRIYAAKPYFVANATVCEAGKPNRHAAIGGIAPPYDDARARTCAAYVCRAETNGTNLTIKSKPHAKKMG